jgi:Uma2 family endonuclease
MAPPGDIHGSIQIKIGSHLYQQGELAGYGKARTEVSVVLSRNPDCLLVPDALFITNQSLPLQHSREGYLETIPEIVVEVRSPNDSWPEIERKVQQYLSAGVHVVWVLDPQSQSVRAYQPSHQMITFGPKDMLTIPQLIPGFQVIVADLFVS